MSEHLQEALALLRRARADFKPLLSDPKHINNLLEINTYFTRIENRLVLMGAVRLEAIVTANGIEVKEAKSLRQGSSSFMGRKVTGKGSLNAKSDKEMMTAAELRQANYLEKVEQLFMRLPRISVASILTNYRSEDDILVLRGVAKRAKVENFDKAAITQEFVTKIIENIKASVKESTTQTLIDKSVGARGDTVTLTQEQIDADPKLQKMGAKAGDQLTIDPKTKKKTIVASAEVDPEEDSE